MTHQVLLPDRVFDSVKGQMLEDHVVIIDGDRVVEASPAATSNETVTTGAPGFTLLPGLIDVHTHLAIPLDDGQGFSAVVQRSGAQDARSA